MVGYLVGSESSVIDKLRHNVWLVILWDLCTSVIDKLRHHVWLVMLWDLSPRSLTN